MQVSDVGERRLIEALDEVIGAQQTSTDQVAGPGFRLRLSIGDDAAAWDGPAGARVLTSDALVEGVHFDVGRTGWADLGWKSLSVNLSDIAAMGCAPLYSVVTLGLRGDLPVDGLVEMYRGMLEACRLHGGAIVGGDTVRSPVFFVAVAMVGVAPASGEGPLLTRAAARPGDKVAVTGSLGCSAGGLRMMRREADFDEETAAHLRDAHVRPTSRVAEGMLLARHEVLAAIDVSDGLIDDLGKMCQASGVGALVQSHLVPADAFLRLAYPDDWLSLALAGGEDYELLFTAPPEVLDDVASHLEVPVTVIGDIVGGPPGVRVLDERGASIQLDREGWDHFGPDPGGQSIATEITEVETGSAEGQSP